ncbi:DUF2188 domain-containing protein [Xanthomonas campestris]|uniref:DUF2188 domain-containing protein n=1 Tax=Xanthomonas campestris TaxID=339 RepID=UPI0038906DF4
MARRYWYVVTKPGGWAVRVGEGLLAQETLFRTQLDAVNHAAAQANAAWLIAKTPSGVRVQGADSRWRDERTYGNDPFPPRG